MVRKIVLGVVVAVIVTLLCVLLGGILAALDVSVAVVVGTWLKQYSTVLGILAGLAYAFSGLSGRSII